MSSAAAIARRLAPGAAPAAPGCKGQGEAVAAGRRKRLSGTQRGSLPWCSKPLDPLLCFRSRRYTPGWFYCWYLPPPGPDSAALTLTTALVCFLHPHPHPHPLHFHALPVLHALPCCLLWAEPVGSTSGLDVSLATHTGRVCLLACVGILKVCDGSVIDHKQTIM